MVTLESADHLLSPVVRRTPRSAADARASRARGPLQREVRHPSRTTPPSQYPLILGFVHSMIWSARTSTDCGIVSPRTLAVLRLITSSNFVVCSTGRSAGFAPFRMRSTYVAARWQLAGMLAPAVMRNPASAACGSPEKLGSL